MNKKISRRDILGFAATGLAGGALLLNQRGDAQAQTAQNASPARVRQRWEKSYSGGPVNIKPLPAGLPGKDYRPVVIPNGAALPFKVNSGVKTFHLIAEEVDHAFDAGLRAKCWGFNGRVNGMVIEAVCVRARQAHGQPDRRAAGRGVDL